MRILETTKLYDRNFPANGMLECSDESVGRVCVVLDGSFIDHHRGSEVFSSGVVVCRPPEVRTLIRFGTSGMRSVTVELSARVFESLRQTGILPKRAASATSSKCLSLAARIALEKDNPDPISKLVTEGLLLELIGEVGRTTSRIHSRHPPSWLKHIHATISRKVVSPASVAEYARIAGVHPAHLARSFRACYGVSIGEYARNIRVQRAANLIVSSSFRLADIAAECGFADHAHMTNCFRRYFGLTPSEYRRSGKKG